MERRQGEAGFGVAVVPAQAVAAHIGAEPGLRQQSLKCRPVDHLPIGFALAALVVQAHQVKAPLLERIFAEAEGEPALIDPVKAVVRADAGADVVLASLDDLAHQMRVGHVGAGHAHHVKLAAGDGMAGGRHIGDLGRVEGRKPRRRADLAREVSPQSAAYPDIPALADFRQLWSTLRADSQLRQSVAHATTDAGPLNSTALANDISLALWATGSGLLIATPMMILGNDIHAKLRRLRDRTERQLQDFLETFEAAEGPAQAGTTSSRSSRAVLPR